jgi:ankyrin repeat protein
MHRRTPRCAAQDGKLPLHYAAAKGAPFEVMELLLDANSNATTAKDKARR